MATPTLEEFMQEVGPQAREAGASDRELRQYWAKNYGAGQIDTAKLPTWESFQSSIKQQQPDLPEKDVRSYWDEHYGDFGAKEQDPGFGSSIIEGAKGGYHSLKASAAGSFERLQDPQSQWHKVGDDAAKAFEEEASKHAAPKEISKQPWYQRFTNPEYLGKLLGEVAVQSAPSLAGAMAGGVVGGIPGAMAGMSAVTYFQQAGSTYREAFQRYKQDGLSEQEAHAKAYQDSGIGGLVSAAVNAMSIPASFVAPFAKRISNLFLQYSLNVGVDTADQITQNAVAQKTFAPERELSEGVPEAIVGSSLMSAPETMGGVKSVISGPAKVGGETYPTVTERTPDEMGLGQPSASEQPSSQTGPLQIEGPPQPGEVRKGTVYSGGPVLDASPLPDVSPVLNANSLDDAIANAVGVVQGATETAKARAAEYARMTARVKNETDALLANAPDKRPAFNVPTLPGPESQPSTLFNQPSPIVPGQAFTPRPEPIDDPRATLAAERARLVAEQDQRKLQQNPKSEVVSPMQAVTPTDNEPLPSQNDLIYPSSKQVRDLIHEKGLHLDTPVFQEILRQTVGKEKFSDLTPQELQRVADAIQKVKPSAPVQETPAPQVPVTPIEKPDKPYAPVTTIPEAQVPRSELTPEKNAEILLRAEKAKADMEIAGTERGGRFFQEQQGQGSTQEVTGLKSATADWYKELTSGPSPAIRGDRKQSARQKIEEAIQKIIKDHGLDRGKAVELVKAALLQDKEFHRTEWGRDLNSIMQGEWPSYMEKPGVITQATGNAEKFQNVPRTTPEVQVEVPKPVKVPVSRKQQLAQEKHKLEAKKHPESISGFKTAKGSTYVIGKDGTTTRDKAPRPEHPGPKERGIQPTSETTFYVDQKNLDPLSLMQAQGGWKTRIEVRGNKAAILYREGPYDGKVIQGTIIDIKKSPEVGLYPVELWRDGKSVHFGNAITEVYKKKPEPLASKAPGMASQPAPASPKREPASPTPEAAPKIKTHDDYINAAKSLLERRIREAVEKDDRFSHLENKVRTVVGMLQGKDGDDLKVFLKHIKSIDPATRAGLEELAVKEPETFSKYASGVEDTLEAAPKTEEPFSLTSPEVSKPKAKEAGPEQLSIDVPPPTVGGKPIIGREATHEEAPLFSKAAQEKDTEQTALPEESAQSPTEILASALRNVADQIQGKPTAAPDTINTVEGYEAFRRRLRDGEVTIDEYKQAFQQVKDNKEALVGELKKLTKDQLIKRSRSFRSSKSDSKDELIRQAYDGMLSTFATGRGVSYVLSGKGGYEQALAKMVESTTEADLTKYAEDIAKTTEEYKQRIEGIENPQTLQNFDDRVRVKGESSLTPEQLARYDELLAQAGREKRKQAQEQKATVQGVDAGTDLQLVESKHTKTGEKLWVVKLANRVERAVYDRLNQAAHKLGGRYSSYNKDGAIPGFTFRSEEAAKSFMAAGKGETVSAAPVREEAKAQVQNNAVAKLREMADSLEAEAEDSLNADRKTNTARRARMASSAENAAYGNKAFAETMRNLADAIESGNATHLSGLRTKTQIATLEEIINEAKRDRIKKETKGSYVDYEKQLQRKAEPEDAAFAEFPQFILYKDNLKDALKELQDRPGTERLRMRLKKLMDGVEDGGKREVPREDVELALAKKAPEKYPPTPYWQWESTSKSVKRLESMGITTLPELRAALREFVEYRGKRGTIDKAKQLERNLIGNKGIGNDFFPTPKETAQRMVAEAGIEPGMKVLEPSAGNGNIAEVIRAAGVNPDVVEQSSNLRDILEAKGFNLTGHDFMDVKDGDYDRIVMNPPFSNGQDAEHIHHAYTLLKPGGKLVAIAGEGIFFRNDAKAKAFRQWLDEVGGTSKKLPEGTFKDSSLMSTTGVNARMVVIEKPVEEVAKPDSFLSFLMDERGSIPASFFGRRNPDETGTIDPTEARERLAAVKSSARPYLLGSLGLYQLSQVYGNDHAEVKTYNQATQDMEADFTEMSRDSDKIARAWVDLKIPVADKMAQVMEGARFLNFDPDPKKNQAADSQKKRELVTRFEQLPDDAKAVYRQARDFYTNMAEQRFQALKERIERAGGTPENTRKLVDRLQLAYEGVRSKVYFPFTRFGEHIVIAKQMKDGKEIDREVHAFESSLEAQKFATMMKLKGWKVKQTVAREYSVDKEGPASKIVRDMHDIIKELGQGQQGLPGVMDLEHQLLDSLNQSFLQALPDMSYAKHFIHAKDVKGASRDALRSFAHSALHGAHHISRIRHADKVTQALMNLDDAINATVEGDTEEARQVYNELVKRHNDIMNPNTHPFSAWLGQLGFTMSLGGVVATGIANATQVPLITYPWLGARYGFGKASAALAKAYKQFLDPRTLNKESLFDVSQSPLITDKEREMLKELARRGRIDLTQTMDLAGLSDRNNLGRRAKALGTMGEKVSRMLGVTFHVPEVMNRQVTALATFRLEGGNDGKYEEGLQRAQQAIQDTHFIYEAWNRPRYMSGNFLRVLTMFKQYSQNIAYIYGRAASIWMDRNGATKEERKVAKRQLVSMLVLQFGAAGALGMPFFGTPISLIMTALGAMDDDDEKRDWEVALRQWFDGKATSLAEAFMDDREQARAVGKTLGAAVSHGASRLTPFDMSTRLGQNDLFFREPQREHEGKLAAYEKIFSLGGPVPGYGVNLLMGLGDVAKGISELNSGFFMRGVEELTPAVLRNGIKSLRYTLEGVRTRDEYKQLDLNTSEKLGQLFGFTPSRVDEMYESITAVKNKEHRALNQRKDLLDRFARAMDDQDDNAKARILEDIQGFNERNPMFGITSQSLQKSIKTRRQHEAGMERGMYLPPRRRELLGEGDFADF